LTELVREEERRVKMASRRQSPKRTPPQNFFPFTPARPDRPNPLALQLDKWDCRILRSIQQNGLKSPSELCRLGKVPIKKFYERFNTNPYLKEALKLLAFSSLAVALPGAMTTMVEKFPENAKWAELYLKVTGLIGEDGMKIIKEEKPKEVDSKTLIQMYVNIYGSGKQDEALNNKTNARLEDKPKDSEG
jgi:hypothetical protein